MTSLEIAEITGKQHKDVLKAIRNMEPAWEKINGRKFALVKYQDAKGESRPCYSLTKTECLYVATKFNDEARAKLVLRWEELERERLTGHQPMSDMDLLARAVLISDKQIKELTMENQLLNEINEELAQENDELTKANAQQSLKLNIQKPLVNFAETVGCSRDTCTIAELAKLLCNNGIAMGQNRLFAWLRDNHYLGASGHHWNVAQQRWVDSGLFVLKVSKPWTDSQGNPHYNVLTLVTGKGQRYFVEVFKGGA